MLGFRSVVCASLRASIAVSAPIYKKQSVIVPLFSWFRKNSARTFCNEAPKITPPPQGVARDVPHKAIDADADLQLDIAPSLPITMEPRKYIEFNCANCDYRVKKTCSTHSYEKGVVLMKCDGCNLIADHLGWTGYGPNAKTIEEIAASMGKTITRIKQ